MADREDSPSPSLFSSSSSSSSYSLSNRRSPSLDRIDRPPSLYRPPIRTPASPPLSSAEVDELTNPNLPYRTGYTYAFSKSYLSTEEDDYEVPNMAGTSFYHETTLKDDYYTEESSSTTATSSVWSRIYEDVITVYYKIITAVYCSLATTYAGGRSIVEWIYYILYSIAYGAWYVVSRGGRSIVGAIYLVLYSITYAVWAVLDFIGRSTYSLVDALMFIPRAFHNYILPPLPEDDENYDDYVPAKRVSLNEDGNEVHYYSSNESIVTNGPRYSTSAFYLPDSVSLDSSVFGGLWTRAVRYLKRGRKTHMEPVYELRSRTIEKEVGDDTDTDDELGIEDPAHVVYHEPVHAAPQRRARTTLQSNQDDYIYETTDDKSTILLNILYLPIDALRGIWWLIKRGVYLMLMECHYTLYYGIQGAANAGGALIEMIGNGIYWTIVYPLEYVGDIVYNAIIIKTDHGDGSESGDSDSGEIGAQYSDSTDEGYGAELYAVPAQSTHQRTSQEDVLASYGISKRRSTRRTSTSSSASVEREQMQGKTPTGRPRERPVKRLATVQESVDSGYSSSSSSSSSSSRFYPAGGIAWAVKDSITTLFAKIIDVFTFICLLAWECVRAVGQLMAGGVKAILYSTKCIVQSIASGTTSGMSGILGLIWSGITSIFSLLYNIFAESCSVIMETIVGIKNGLLYLLSFRPSVSSLCSALKWLLILLPLILLLLWFAAMPPFKKEHDEVVADYVKRAHSIMEDYYEFGQHHTRGFIGGVIETIKNGLIWLWNLLWELGRGLVGLIIYFRESFMTYLAGIKIDRYFAPSPPSGPAPPPASVPAPVPVVPLSSSDCPPAPAPVYIPSPPAAPSPAEQEALVAAIVARVSAQMEQRLADSLNGRIHVIEESVRKAEEELRAKITVAHEPIDYSNLDALIAAAIRKYDSDKTGLVDYALESSGGQIVSTRCSETYALSTRVEKIFDIPLYYSNYGPRVVIQRNSQALVPGECWAFKGGIGYLTIKLAVPIKVTSVSYEHIPKSISRNGENKSAPKTFTIFTYEKDEYDFSSRFELGKFAYDAHGEPLQFFPVQNLPPYPVQIVEFQVDSNWGEQYTCLYRFRVHGDNLYK